MRVTFALAAASALSPACGGGLAHPALFSTDWQDDGGVSIARIWDRASSAPVPAHASLALGVTQDGGTLIGLPLEPGARRWSFHHALDARPAIAASVVVGSGAGETFALDANDGHLLWTRPAPGLRLVGAGDDGTTTVATFERTEGGGAFIAVARDGRLLQRIDADKSLGTPAAMGGFAFVPWAGQYVSAVDLATGDESARATLRSLTGRAWTESGALWFGGLAFVRFDAHIRDASRGGASIVRLPALGLPGDPKLGDERIAPLPLVASAQDRVRLFASPSAAASGAGLADDRVYATYFRLAMGFEPEGKLRWVVTHESADFIGGAATKGGLVLCDDKGGVTEIDARGGDVLSTADLGVPLQACVVSAERFAAAQVDSEPLAAQIEKAVTTQDPELVAAQKLLLQQLASVEDPSATRTLIRLAGDPGTPPDLLAASREALSKRRSGADDMLTALAQHYDYLKGALRAPPVGPIADALAAMNETEAAPLLASHLLDPEDSTDDVRRAAQALVTLASPREIPALRRFFGMYRATADSDDIAAAVGSVAKALLSLKGDPAAVQEVKAAATSPLTVAAVRDQLSVPEEPGAQPDPNQDK